MLFTALSKALTGKVCTADLVCYPTLVCFAISLVAIRALQLYLRERQLPPGPWGLPILGFLPYLKGAPHIQFFDLSKIYGSIFSARFGSHLVVVLSDYKLIRRAFAQEVFTARPDNEITALMDGYGLINIDGHLWKDQRRFLHDRLRSFGMKLSGRGREQLEARIMVEVDSFLQGLAESRGRPCSLGDKLFLSVHNVICGILMSVRFTQDDRRFQRFMHLIEEGFRLVTSTGSSNYIPAMRNLPRIKAVNRKIRQNSLEMRAFFKEIVDEHRSTFDPNNIRDLIDSYLIEIENAQLSQQADELYAGKDPDRQIYQVLMDLYSAATETVKISLQWGIVYMLHHPEVKKAVQDELDQVVGRHRLPTVEDMPYLPYTEATIMEILRRSTVVPMGTTHATAGDIELDGFQIPKNSQIIPLIHAVHMDPTLWDEPEKFNPSRFLSKEGSVIKPEYFMPFGVGRRKCLGEVMARMEMFLFFTCLFHVYDLELPEGADLPAYEGSGSSIVQLAENCQVRAIPRDIDLKPLFTDSIGLTSPFSEPVLAASC